MKYRESDQERKSERDEGRFVQYNNVTITIQFSYFEQAIFFSFFFYKNAILNIFIYL